MGEQEYRECVEKTFENFQLYDQYVEITSSWEQFLTDTYSSLHRDFHFDRFPTHRTDMSDNSVSPDFSVLFNRTYAVVFLVYHEMPRNEGEFQEVLDKIEQFDQELVFNGDDIQVVPNTQDIALLISNENSQTAQYRLNEALSSGDLELDSNLVIMDYRYVDPEVEPKYRFQRLAMVGDNFRDGSLPDQFQISSRFSMDGGGFHSLQLNVFDIHERKATGVLCNKEPNELYLASYLWHMVLRDRLDDGQEIIWQQNDPRKTIELKIDTTELIDKLNGDYIPGGQIKREWLDSTLEYLCEAKVAHRLAEDEFRVDYRNLQDKKRKYNDVVTDPNGISHLAGLFAEFHCENRVELSQADFARLTNPDPDKEPTEIDEDLSQPEIGDF